MGHETEIEARRKAFAPYQVNQAVMESAPGAVFMHCLPAHRGEEVTDEVIDGPARWCSTRPRTGSTRRWP